MAVHDEMRQSKFINKLTVLVILRHDIKLHISYIIMLPPIVVV